MFKDGFIIDGECIDVRVYIDGEQKQDFIQVNNQDYFNFTYKLSELYDKCSLKDTQNDSDTYTLECQL